MVQPSGPSNQFWSNFGSVWAWYTTSGGAAKRLVTTTWVSPSVFSVNLLIVFLLFSVVPCWPEPRLAGRSFSPALLEHCQPSVHRFDTALCDATRALRALETTNN